MPDPIGPIAVTGATGYVAGHVVRELLQRGHTVHATARDPSNPAKIGHLQALAETLPGTLAWFAADLLEEGSFADAIAGCAVVVHTASPFLMGKQSDPQAALVEPALKGTRNVLQTASDTDTVQRVVLTSSVASIHGDATDRPGHGDAFTEEDWNTSSSLEHNPYSYSKTVAEREAWRLAEAQDRWRLVVVNPSFVMGPSLTARNDSASIDFMLAMIDGRRRTGIWNQYMGWVDVRDVAIAHAQAATLPDASGRHLLAAQVAGFADVREWLREDFGDRVSPPRWIIPRWLSFLVGPLNGYSIRHVRNNVDVPVALDNRRSREALGLAYRPLRDTIREHVEQIIRDGLYTPA